MSSSSFPVKILSYIQNFNKVLFVCPICFQQQSVMLADGETFSILHKCSVCKQEYIADVSILNETN